MRLEIKQYEPTNFTNNQVHNKKTQTLYSKKRVLLLGRDPSSSQLNQQEDFVVYKHKSVSRRHVAVRLPPFFVGMGMGMGEMPGYYERFGGRWKQLPRDIRAKIRQYCSPQNILLITDLNSKYGLYKQLTKLTLTPTPIPLQSTTITEQSLTEHTLHVSQNKEQIIQFGNQTVLIVAMLVDVCQGDMGKFRGVIQGRIGGVRWIQGFDRAENISMKLFSCLILKQPNTSQPESPKHHGIILTRAPSTCSKKLSIGRHSFNSLQINKSSISRKQASLYVSEKGQWVIEDERSTNMTWLRLEKILFPIGELRDTEGEEGEEEEEEKVLLENWGSRESQGKREKFKTITIKLGEVRTDIQIQELRPQDESFENKITKSDMSYQKILIDL